MTREMLEEQFAKLKSLLGEAMLEISLLRLEVANLRRTNGAYARALAPPSKASARAKMKKELRESGVLPKGKAG